MRVIGAILLAMLFQGCAAVRVPAPVGVRPMVLQADDWSGLWCSPAVLPFDGDGPDATHECGRLVIVDAEHGVMDLTEDESDDILRLHVWTIGESDTEAFVTAEDEHGYALAGRLRRTSGAIVFWGVQASGFRDATARGVLRADRDLEHETDVFIAQPGAAEVERVAADMTHELFAWRQPELLLHMRRE